MASAREQPGTDAAWQVVDAAVAVAADRLGEALISAYAIGSLAHGGFRRAVSDGDLALYDLVRYGVLVYWPGLRFRHAHAPTRSTSTPPLRGCSILGLLSRRRSHHPTPRTQRGGHLVPDPRFSSVSRSSNPPCDG